MARSKDSAASGEIADSPLSAANRAFSQRFPGETGKREPAHVVYGGAHLFRAGTCRKLGDLALQALTDYGPDREVLTSTFGVPASIAEPVHTRVKDKLVREPIEDFRIDFEDGYGVRDDSEEDEDASNAARETSEAMQKGSLPPFFGIRIKPMNEEWKYRAVRTLRRYLDDLLAETGGQPPSNFVVTLPKITVPEQVAELTRELESYPRIEIEMMIETPQSLCRIPELIDAASGRCVAAHFGPYDYTASLGIAASRQSLRHPACDAARSLMQIHFAGTGIRLSDGPTNILPIPPHRGEPLSSEQIVANRSAVHHAWKLHFQNVSHALDNGFYQGWDLHPGQLPARFAAVQCFFLEGLDAAATRLRNFIAQATHATRVGGVFDDAATGQGLLNYFRRAVNSRAVSEEEAASLTGLTLPQMRSASFAAILRDLSATTST